VERFLNAGSVLSVKYLSDMIKCTPRYYAAYMTCWLQ